MHLNCEQFPHPSNQLCPKSLPRRATPPPPPCSYDPFRGFLRSIDTYVLGAFADEDHIYVILFSWFLSGITGLVQRSGGAQVRHCQRHCMRSLHATATATATAGVRFFFFIFPATHRALPEHAPPCRAFEGHGAARRAWRTPF